ncbi:PREDICTED: uncharacterized protein LOC109337416 [Lupinus angustifolius]|uniref:uncharacterized protein LOC109337416 n=1 Tax=Lupinus angustifolius TaxID=3871 RepID=UPI00092EE5F4|nr:PREDICTED: uncharacterized protein LOC109337416 [Lupinus angustifolius]
MEDINFDDSQSMVPPRIDLQNPCNPYYLHPGEIPGCILVTKPLEGRNYHSWSKSMRRALLSKNKYKFVDGYIRIPKTSDPEYDTWERCNTMVASWITRTLNPQIAESIVNIDSAQELWQDLRDTFSKGDYFRISNLLQEVHSTKQGDRDISTYFTALKTFWEDLESLRQLPTCTCDIQCKCNLVKRIKENREPEYVICFLKGLNDQYHTSKSQILLMEPLPTINKTFSLVIQAEGQVNEQTSGESKVLFNSQEQPWKQASRRSSFNITRGRCRTGGRFYNNRSTPVKVCTHCGKERHTIETCYFKHEFPPNYNKLRPIMGSANNITKTQSTTTSTNKDKGTGLQFNPAQYAQLTSLLQQAEINPT